jgi:HlyD family secretion protein
MDQALPVRAGERWLRKFGAGFAALAAFGALALVWGLRPSTLTMVASPQFATVVSGIFRDELVLRARAEPLHSVQIDAAEAGRVEAVMAHEGDSVAAGAPLFLLQSPEQEQVWMQRSAEVAQQMANVSLQRSAQAESAAANRRELAQLLAAQEQAEADSGRQAALAAAGFVSPAALEQAERQRALTTQLLRQAREDQAREAEIRAQSLAEMARAVEGLQHGLRWLERSRERLLQRAPMAGQLTGFNVQVGASVRAGDRLGRIDDPRGGLQLAAEVDEFYLPRLHAGQMATSSRGELRLMQTLPQVQGGKVRALFQGAQGQGVKGQSADPASPSASSPLESLHPGQAVELRLQLSPPSPALLLPEGPGVLTQLYVREGQQLHRRTVQLGRRAAGQVEVLGGLQAGDQVLLSQPPTDAERLALP